MKTRREQFIWFFIHRLGGVSAVARRMILRRQGVFTWSDIHGEFCRRYPGIDAACCQITDAFDALEKSGRIECIFNSPNGKLYQRTAWHPAVLPDQIADRQQLFEINP